MTDKEFIERIEMCKDIFLYYSKKIDFSGDVNSIQEVIKQIDVILDIYLALKK